MTTCTNSFETICRLLKDHFDEVDPSLLTPHATFKSLGLDSLGLMELFVVLQQELGITLAGLDVDLDLGKNMTLAEVAALLGQHTPATGTPATEEAAV